MVIYLRDKNKENLFEVEIWENKEGIEVKPHIYFKNCAEHVLNNFTNLMYLRDFISEFDYLEELRGWYFEKYRQSKKPQDYASVLKELRTIIRLIAQKFDFYVVED